MADKASAAFDQFRHLARKLLGVPKAEVEAQRRKIEANREPQTDVRRRRKLR
jgi:hypothetical protein